MTRGLWPKPSTAAETLAYVEAPHFTAGMVIQAGEVVRAAPILKWTVGRRWLGADRATVSRVAASSMPQPIVV